MEHTKTDVEPLAQQILGELVERLNDSYQPALQASVDTLGKLTARVTPGEMVEHIQFMRNALRTLISSARHRKGGVGEGEFLLPAFQLKGGLNTILPIFLEALKKGSGNSREQVRRGSTGVWWLCA